MKTQRSAGGSSGASRVRGFPPLRSHSRAEVPSVERSGVELACCCSEQAQVHAQGRSTHGLLLIMLCAVLWGTVGVVIKAIYQLAATNPLEVGFLRLAIAVPVLFLTCWLTQGLSMFRIARRDLVLMLLLGVMTALYQVCYFAAIRFVGVAIAVLVTLCTAPVLVALLSAMLLREQLKRRILLSGGCALAGTILLVGIQPSVVSVQGSTMIIGVLLAVGSALGYAVITLCSRTLTGRYHPLQSLTVGFGAGAAVLLPFTLSTGFVVSYPVVGWVLLLYLGLIPTALAYVLFFAGMRYTTATTASIATLLEPLTSTALAWLLFGERLGPLALFGAVLLLSAIALLYRNTPS